MIFIYRPSLINNDWMVNTNWTTFFKFIFSNDDFVYRPSLNNNDWMVYLLWKIQISNKNFIKNNDDFGYNDLFSICSVLSSSSSLSLVSYWWADRSKLTAALCVASTRSTWLLPAPKSMWARSRCPTTSMMPSSTASRPRNRSPLMATSSRPRRR